MKKTMLFCALLTLSASAGLGQNTKGGETMVDFQSPKKTQPEKPAAVTQPKPTSELLGRRVIYGGYLTDFFRAEKKRPLFSLRTPVDPKREGENLIYNHETNRIRGVALFSIKF